MKITIAQRLKKGMEEINGKLIKNAAWYVIYTTMKREQKVKNWLDNKGIENHLPLQTIVRLWNTRKKKMIIPAMPRCLFVHISTKDVAELINEKEFSFLLKADGLYASITDEEMNAFRNTNAEADEFVAEKQCVLLSQLGLE